MVQLVLNSISDTDRLASAIATLLKPPTTLLLQGQIGAGKTHLVRKIIQALLIEPEDVPSPTFTLVQEYESRIGHIWHADLYRLTHPDDIVELGLPHAFDTDICFVEWPDRLNIDYGPHAILIDLSVTELPDQRIMSISDAPSGWESTLKKALNGE